MDAAPLRTMDAPPLGYDYRAALCSGSQQTLGDAMTTKQVVCLVGLGGLGLLARRFWLLPTVGQPSEAEFAAEWNAGSGSLGTDEDVARWVKASMRGDLPRRQLVA